MAVPSSHCVTLGRSFPCVSVLFLFPYPKDEGLMSQRCPSCGQSGVMAVVLVWPEATGSLGVQNKEAYRACPVLKLQS